MKKKATGIAKRVWKFLWEDDSIWSWAVNIAIAFLLIKFLVLPGLGVALGTNYPVVAVVSGSMEHGPSFNDWWHTHEAFYQQFNITRQDFETYPLQNGFNVGDIIVLSRADKQNLKVGDVVVFRAQDPVLMPDPIIHRIVAINDAGGYFETKGDANTGQIRSFGLDETMVPWSHLIGKAWIRVPYLGYIKIWFVDAWDAAKSLVVKK